jgi:hypothetical protein
MTGEPFRSVEFVSLVKFDVVAGLTMNLTECS